MSNQTDQPAQTNAGFTPLCTKPELNFYDEEDSFLNRTILKVQRSKSKDKLLKDRTDVSFAKDTDSFL